MAKENPFEKYGKENISEIKKSDIFDAMMENGDYKNVSITKTGKQIKEQLFNIVIPKLVENKDNCIKEIEGLLEVTGVAPTKDFRFYERVKLDIPYKEYNYDETYFREDKKEETKPQLFTNFAIEEDSDSEDMKATIEEIVNKNYPMSLEEAENRQKYNDKLRCLANILIDLKTAETLSNNLDENRIFNLSVAQSLALMF